MNERPIPEHVQKVIDNIDYYEETSLNAANNTMYDISSALDALPGECRFSTLTIISGEVQKYAAAMFVCENNKQAALRMLRDDVYNAEMTKVLMVFAKSWEMWPDSEACNHYIQKELRKLQPDLVSTRQSVEN